MKKPVNIKKIILPNLPYLLFALLGTKCGQAARLAPGLDFSQKALHILDGFRLAFESLLPSFHPADLLVGLLIAAALRLAVYVKGKNARKFRKNIEYGSARWGTHEDIAPYIDPVFENNIILTQTESLTMLNEFVEKILVHERARKGSQDTTQEVEIYFNFVGRYIPPALQPVPLTPEEQEELRKKEERKDRLHQNYLRRKANGKQKEWEERYNAKRKAQVEAAKAAIRAEDMEKGIFTTVSQLPRQEPRKATVSASAAV